MKYPIKQLGVGGILDQSINVVRDHASLLFFIVAFTIVPLQAIFGLLHTKLQQAINSHDQNSILTLALLLIPTFLMLSIVSILVNASITQAIANAYLSRKVIMGSCFRHALTRFWSLLGTIILVVLAIMGGMMLCLIPGIIFALWFGLAQYVTILEATAGTEAMTRSRALMKGNMFTALGLGLILVAINIPMAVGVTMIPEKHLGVVAVALVQGAGTVFGTAATVVFYYSCRCKVEDFDLLILANAIVANAPPLNADVIELIDPE